MSEKIYELIIIGAGPAGLSAGIYASRAELDCLVLERSEISGGQVLSTYEVDNYPGIPGVTGSELSGKMREHCDRLGVRFECEEVRSMTKTEDGLFRLLTWSKKEYLTCSVIVATGASHKLLGIPGEDDFAGMGVSYCATCDGAFFRDRVCAVVGGGNVALEDAIYLSKVASKVYLIHRRDSFRASAALVTKAKTISNINFVTDTVVSSITGSDSVEALQITNVKTGDASELKVDGVFVAVGIDPASELVKSLADTNDAGYVIADETCTTSCPGLYVAGDLRSKPLRQIISAAADGANAVTSVTGYLQSV